VLPSADTYVTPDKPTSNYGSETTVETDDSPVQRILMRFVVDQVGSNEVTSAKLKLYGKNSSDKGGDFYRLDDSLPPWTEGQVTWATAPGTVGDAIASLGPVSSSKWYEVDLRSLITGDGTYNIAVTTTSSDGAGYSSKEGSSSYRPQLVITYDVPAETEPPTATIDSPATGDTVLGTVSVQATAADNVAVKKVEFFVDGTLTATDTSSPFSFQWDTTKTTNGSRALAAKAYDTSGNVGESSAVVVTVDNPPDLTPPSAPTLSATAKGPNTVELSWTASSDDTGVAGYDLYRGGTLIHSTSSTTYTNTGLTADTAYEYFVKAHDAALNYSDASNTVTVTTPKVSSVSFSFGIAGDLGANSKTAYSLSKLDTSGVSFFAAIGDLDYGEVSSPAAWCSYIKSHLPTLGSSFPFELVAGTHEDETIKEHAACLPDRLNSKIGPNAIYGGEYYFDYPASNPLVRVIMISPKLSIMGSSYSYSKGSAHYNFVASALDDAAAKGIPWTVVGHHMTSPGSDITNLFVAKKVDLVVYGHSHGYGRGSQLTTCSSGTSFDCVSDSGSDGVYPKNAGTIFLKNGSFGQGSPNGFTKFTVSADRIDAQFVGKTTDVWSIQ
jgi:hypothetical protein